MARKRPSRASSTNLNLIINSIILTVIIIAGAVLFVQQQSEHGSPTVAVWRRFMLANSSSNGSFNGNSTIPYLTYESPIEPPESTFLTFSTPVYRPERYSIIVEQRFLVAIDRATSWFTKVVQGVAQMQTALQPFFQDVGFAGAGCVTMNLTSNSTSVRTGIVALLTQKDYDDYDRPYTDELPWSHCNGTCSITVYTDVNSTYATSVGGPLPYNFSTSYALRPKGYSSCIKAKNDITTYDQQSYYYQSHPLGVSYATPVVRISKTLGPLTQTVVAAFVNTSCTYISGNLTDGMEDSFDGIILNLVEESILGTWLNFDVNDTDPAFTQARCRIGDYCSEKDGTFAQYRLEPIKTYYLVLINQAAFGRNVTATFSIRDEASCQLDGFNNDEYSDYPGPALATPADQEQLEQEGAQAACLAAGLTTDCTTA